MTISTVIRAHEFWLEAQPSYQKTDRTTEITINVGQQMDGQSLPNIPAWYRQFDAITGDGLRPVGGELGSDPAGYVNIKTPEVYAIGYERMKKSVTLKPEKFTQYLKQEGLEKIIKHRDQLNESEKNGFELFYRNVKAIIKVGDKNEHNFYNYDFNHPLNISPLQNPYELSKGDDLRVQLTFKQKPAANLLLHGKIKNKPQPGYSSGYKHINDNEYECNFFYNRLKKDVPASYIEKFDNKCLPGFYKIFLALDKKNDYHWYVQNKNKLWSHKPGHGEVTDIDASKNKIKNPSSANRDYGYLNYNTSCFYACVHSDLSRALDNIYKLK